MKDKNLKEIKSKWDALHDYLNSLEIPHIFIGFPDDAHFANSGSGTLLDVVRLLENFVVDYTQHHPSFKEPLKVALTVLAKLLHESEHEQQPKNAESPLSEEEVKFARIFGTISDKVH